jgi:hypothetical protein
MDLIVSECDMIFIDIVPAYREIPYQLRKTNTMTEIERVPFLQLDLLPISARLRSDEFLEIADCII